MALQSFGLLPESPLCPSPVLSLGTSGEGATDQVQEEEGQGARGSHAKTGTVPLQQARSQLLDRDASGNNRPG
jgi:hypothetical protein